MTSNCCLFISILKTVGISDLADLVVMISLQFFIYLESFNCAFIWFWMIVLLVIVFLLGSFFPSMPWIYHFTPLRPTRFLQKNPLIMLAELPRMRWFTILLLFSKLIFFEWLLVTWLCFSCNSLHCLFLRYKLLKLICQFSNLNLGIFFAVIE